MKTPSASLPKAAVVADDVDEWRTLAGTAVRRALGPDVEMHEAKNGRELVERVQALRESGIEPFVLSDIHMDQLDPSNNGDFVLSKLAMEGSLPRFALLSGTHSDPRALRVAQAAFGARLLRKSDALRGGQGSEDFVEALRTAATSEPVLDTSPRALRALSDLTQRAIPVSEYRLLLDALRPIGKTLYDRYASALEVIPKAHEILTLGSGSDLSDLSLDPAGRVHEIKNALVLLKNTLDKAGAPRGLRRGVTALCARLADGFAEAVAREHSTDLSMACLEAADRHHLSRKSIEIENGVQRVQVKPSMVVEILSDLIQNAHIHGQEDPRISLLQPARVCIRNTVPQGAVLPFVVRDNQVDGRITSTSDFGTGTGVERIIATVRSIPGATFNLRQERDEVIAELLFSIDEQDTREKAEVDVTQLEIKTEFPNVIFLDHDNRPERTFRFIDEVEGLQYHFLQCPSKLFWGGATVGDAMPFLREHADLLNSACLVVSHMSTGGIDGVFRYIADAYPQVVLLPVSHYPEQLQFNYQLNRFDTKSPMPLQVATPRSIARYSGHEEVVPYSLYSAEPSDQAWAKVVIAATQHAAAFKDKPRGVLDDADMRAEYFREESRRIALVARGDLSDSRIEHREGKSRETELHGRSTHRRHVSRSDLDAIVTRYEKGERNADSLRERISKREVEREMVREGLKAWRPELSERSTAELWRDFKQTLQDDVLRAAERNRSTAMEFICEVKWIGQSILTSLRFWHSAYQYGEEMYDRKNVVQRIKERYGDSEVLPNLFPSVERFIDERWGPGID